MEARKDTIIEIKSGKTAEKNSKELTDINHYIFSLEAAKCQTPKVSNQDIGWFVAMIAVTIGGYFVGRVISSMSESPSNSRELDDLITTAATYFVMYYAFQSNITNCWTKTRPFIDCDDQSKAADATCQDLHNQYCNFLSYYKTERASITKKTNVAEPMLTLPVMIGCMTIFFRFLYLMRRTKGDLPLSNCLTENKITELKNFGAQLEKPIDISPNMKISSAINLLSTRKQEILNRKKPSFVQEMGAFVDTHFKKRRNSLDMKRPKDEELPLLEEKKHGKK